MFDPLQPSDDLDYYQIPYIHPPPPAPMFQQATISNNNNNNFNITTTGKRLRQPEKKSSPQFPEVVGNNIINDDGSCTDHKLKRIIHRDIERQRRQEMANLYASLRSLLPLEYIKGKRSIADHMQEAVNYIKYLQKNIEELGVRRDEIMKKASSSNSKTNSNNNGSSASEDGSGVSVSPNSSTVTVNLCRDGALEILISGSCNLKELTVNFPISKVLKKLVEEGFNVISCISTKSNEFVTVHRILTAEVRDTKCINIMELQQKLSNIINRRQSHADK